MQPKTIALYSHGVRRAGDYFDYRIDDLTRLQLTDYFVHIVNSHSWSSLKHDLYGLKFYYAILYSLGLRLGEGLRLQVGDIDADRMRVQVRNAKGNRDRFVPLPENTLQILRRFWQTHRNPALLFPNRKCGLKKAHLATTPLDRGGIQITLRQVTCDCGLKKELRHTACATVMPPT